MNLINVVKPISKFGKYMQYPLFFHFCILEKKKKFLSFILEHKKKEPFLHACDVWKKEALWQSVILLKQEKRERE